MLIKVLTVDEIQAFNKSIELYANLILQTDEEDGGYEANLLLYFSDKEYRNATNDEIKEDYKNKKYLFQTDNINVMLGVRALEFIFQNKLSVKNKEIYNKHSDEILNNYIKYLNLKKLATDSDLLYDDTIEDSEEEDNSEITKVIEGRFDKGSNQNDYVGKPVEIVKQFLSIVKNVDINGKEILNQLGLPEAVNQNFYIRMLQEDTVEIDTWEELTDILNDKSNRVYQSLKRQFEAFDDTIPEDETQKKQFLNIVNFKNLFLQQFVKIKLEYYTHTVYGNGAYTIREETSFKSKRQVLDKASSNFNLLRARNKNNVVKNDELNVELLEKQISEPKHQNFKKEVIKKLEFLKTIGFTFSNSNMYDIDTVSKVLKEYNTGVGELNNKINYFYKSWLKEYNDKNKKTINPFRGENILDGSLYYLVNLENEFTDSDFNSVFLNARKKLIYPFQLQSTLSKIVKKLRKSSYRYRDLKLVALSDFKQNNKAEQISSLKEPQAFLVRYMSAIESNIYPYILGDSKSMSYGFKNITLPFKTLLVVDYYDSYLEIMVHELNQYLKNNNVSSREIDIYYNKNFTITEELLKNAPETFKLLLSLLDTNKKITEDDLVIVSTKDDLLIDLLKEEIGKHIDKKYKDYVRLIEKNKLPIPEKYNNVEYLTTYVVSSEYVNWIQTQLFTGDLAYH